VTLREAHTAEVLKRLDRLLRAGPRAHAPTFMEFLTARHRRRKQSSACACRTPMQGFHSTKPRVMTRRTGSRLPTQLRVCRPIASFRIVDFVAQLDTRRGVELSAPDSVSDVFFFRERQVVWAATASARSLTMPATRSPYLWRDVPRAHLS